jgi:hypothetical protein
MITRRADSSEATLDLTLSGYKSCYALRPVWSQGPSINSCIGMVEYEIKVNQIFLPERWGKI